MLDCEKELLEKFRKMSQWMCNDISLSMFCAKANFLVAMGLMNYTEIVGSFIVGEYQKDASSKIMKNKKGKLGIIYFKPSIFPRFFFIGFVIFLSHVRLFLRCADLRLFFVKITLNSNERLVFP
jgi:hypothetical protein